jgi:hypothetical protein
MISGYRACLKRRFKMKKKLLGILGLCFMLCSTLSLFAVDVHAQEDGASSKSNDKNLATKHGVADSLASSDDRPKEKYNPETGRMEKINYDEEGGTTKTQLALGLGSIPVTYFILKFL